MRRFLRNITLYAFMGSAISLSAATQSEDGSMAANQKPRRLVYIASDLKIPFWGIVQRGVAKKAADNKCSLEVYSADNSTERELKHVVQAIRSHVDGIIISPTSSSACSTILELAERSGVPVVIADIGTDEGSYVSYIASDNLTGAYHLGRELAARMLANEWQNGTVGIVAIPQDRINGRMRTAGFMQALEEAGIKGGGIEQQVNFSAQETYEACMQLIQKNQTLRALWLQGSNQYKAALQAIEDTGKTGQIVLVTFDAEPEFIDLIREGALLGAAMQQPYLMGQVATSKILDHLAGKAVEREIMLPTLTITQDNLESNLTIIHKNVLGLDTAASDEP